MYGDQQETRSEIRKTLHQNSANSVRNNVEKQTTLHPCLSHPLHQHLLQDTDRDKCRVRAGRDGEPHRGGPARPTVPSAHAQHRSRGCLCQGKYSDNKK